MVYMDIDYMDNYKDFTVNEEFRDFPQYVENLKKDHIRLVPIIDAGVKSKRDMMYTRKESRRIISVRDRTEVIS